MSAEEQKARLEEQKVFLSRIAARLKEGGFTVNWSSKEEEIGPALIVNGRCLLGPKHTGSNKVYGKFWHEEDLELKKRLQSLLGNDISFANYCFDLGGPSVGALVE